MGNLFQNRYRIHTARAEWHGYDGGIYFVTICTAGREHYFGEIETEKEPFMQLSPIGQYANQLMMNITILYPHVEIPLFVIMPNHIHAIIYIDGEAIGGTNAKGEMKGGDNENAINVGNDGDAMKGGNNGDAMNRVSTGGVTGKHNPMVTNCLGTVVRGLKARVTRWAGIPFDFTVMVFLLGLSTGQRATEGGFVAVVATVYEVDELQVVESHALVAVGSHVANHDAFNHGCGANC